MSVRKAPPDPPPPTRSTRFTVELTRSVGSKEPPAWLPWAAFIVTLASLLFALEMHFNFL